MKHYKIGLFISSILLVIACGGNKTEEIPADLEGKITYLADKKSQARDLQIMIDNLEKEIQELNPHTEKEPIIVDAHAIQAQEFKRYIEVQANVIADDIVNVSSDIGGRLLKILVEEGQSVKRGQLVAVTDMQTYEKQLEEINTSLDLADIVFERQKRLWEQNIGSEMQYLEAKNNKERLEKSLQTLQSQISKKNIYAPISGIVDKEFLQAGEIASPGMPIVQIMDPNKVKIVADVQESLLGKIKNGDKVEIFFPSLNQTITNKITMIGRTIDISNRTFEIEIATDSQKGTLKPNLLAKVKLNDYTKPEALVIPLEALREGVDGRKFVFLIDGDTTPEKAKKSYVKLGESTDGYAVIEEGIKIGDRVIIAGTGALSDNYPVIESNKASLENE